MRILYFSQYFPPETGATHVIYTAKIQQNVRCASVDDLSCFILQHLMG